MFEILRNKKRFGDVTKHPFSGSFFFSFNLLFPVFALNWVHQFLISFNWNWNVIHSFFYSILVFSYDLQVLIDLTDLIKILNVHWKCAFKTDTKSSVNLSVMLFRLIYHTFLSWQIDVIFLPHMFFSQKAMCHDTGKSLSDSFTGVFISMTFVIL